MIKFFRNIRRRLITENKAGRYLKYAIGEIVLVVLGILIALQINTWNENRKAKDVEIATLKELRADLKQNLEDISNDQKYFEFCKTSTHYVLEHFENPLAPKDSLSYHFWYMYPFSTFSINSTTFDNLRQAGSNTITNDSLRLKLADFYTKSMNLYKELEQRALIYHDQQFITPMKMSEFVTFGQGELVLKDYDTFFANSSHRQVLNKSIYILNNLTQYQNFVMEDLKALIEQITQEIDASD